MTAVIPLSDLDALWFRRHPNRQYRLRHSVGDELRPYGEGMTGWTIVRREDGAIVWFGYLDRDIDLTGIGDEGLTQIFVGTRALRQRHLQ